MGWGACVREVKILEAGEGLEGRDEFSASGRTNLVALETKCREACEGLEDPGLGEHVASARTEAVVPVESSTQLSLSTQTYHDAVFLRSTQWPYKKDHVNDEDHGLGLY